MNDFRNSGFAVPALDVFDWGPPHTFLGVPQEGGSFASAGVVILPVPYEATVSFMTGTKHGPRAIVEASKYIELYDHEVDAEPHEQGIFTLPELILDGSGPERAMAELGRVIAELIDAGKFVILLGGEHSLASPAILEHAARCDGRLSVLQFDAHADLRTEYDGTPFSHACAMYRVYDKVDLVPVGIRSLTSPEMDLVRREKIPMVFSHQLKDADMADRVLESLGDEVYITFDVDFFDPALVPSTGTPEPGGGTWHQTVDLLERVFREKRVVGCDVVELAPIAGMVAPDFMIAKLVYKLIAFHGLSGR